MTKKKQKMISIWVKGFSCELCMKEERIYPPRGESKGTGIYLPTLYTTAITKKAAPPISLWEVPEAHGIWRIPCVAFRDRPAPFSMITRARWSIPPNTLSMFLVPAKIVTLETGKQMRTTPCKQTDPDPTTMAYMTPMTPPFYTIACPVVDGCISTSTFQDMNRSISASDA